MHSSSAVPVKGEQAKKIAVVAQQAPLASNQISNRLALGAGCYWGTEKYVKKGTFGLAYLIRLFIKKFLLFC